VLGVLLLMGCGDEVTVPDQLDVPGPAATLDVDRLTSNRSTNHPFVLVTVVNRRTDEARTAAIDFEALELALAQQHSIRAPDVAEHLRAARSGRFMFTDPVALKNVWPRYSPEELEEARAVLQSRTAEQIVWEQNSLDSALNSLSQERHGGPYGYMRSVLHLLLERGVHAGASCIPGLVYVEQ
jgi:hypothetical protein